VLVVAPRPSTSWLVTWALLALGPLVAYALPLVRWALADTPLAYLVWVPPIAMVWAVDNLRRLPPYPDDGEVDALTGGALAVGAGGLLVAGPHLWPYAFAARDLALALWPLWALALAWLWFGVGATRAVAAPLAYLWLAWPPLLTAAANRTEALLLALDRSLLDPLLTLAARGWVRVEAGGTLLVAHAGRAVPVTVASACSGADALLAAVVVLPFLLTRTPGRAGAKAAFALLAGVLALVANLVRVVLLLAALHLWGPTVALGPVHALLGPLLFVVLALFLAALAARGDLVPLEPPTPGDGVALPNPSRTLAGLFLAVALTAVSLPAAAAPPGAPGRPIAVRSLEVGALVPRPSGFAATPLGTFDDASVLGPGARAAAVALSGPRGAFVLAQVWVTPSLVQLGAYAYRDCLAFHGDRILAVRPLGLGRATAAAAYAVRLPGPTPGVAGPLYLAVEWTHALTAGDRTAYARFSLAAPAQGAAVWQGEPSARIVPPPANLAPWDAPAQGRMPAALASALPHLAALATRVDNALMATGRR
jgi:exosortase/archaeosortase family protein